MVIGGVVIGILVISGVVISGVVIGILVISGVVISELVIGILVIFTRRSRSEGGGAESTQDCPKS